MQVFTVYGGAEGEKVGRKVQVYLRSNGISAFLASPRSPDLNPSEDFQARIDRELKNADLAIVVVTDGIRDSRPALGEIDRILDDLRYPCIPFVRKGVDPPDRLRGMWHVPFQSTIPREFELIQLN